MATDELLHQFKLANDARIEARERYNSQTHAEELLFKISAFLGGWTFANLDPECGEEADALEAEINTLLAYGWPRAQYPSGPTPPVGEGETN